MFRSTPSVENFIHFAAEGNLAEVTRYLNTKKDDHTILNAGWTNGETALITAIRHNQIKIVSLLLNTPGININAANQDGNTPLIFAAIHGRTDIAALLLTNTTININAVNQDGFSALGKAAQQGRIEIVRFLLAMPDTNLYIRNIFGRNAAEEAHCHGHPEITDLIQSAMQRNPLRRNSLFALPIPQAGDDLGFSYDEAVSCVIC